MAVRDTVNGTRNRTSGWLARRLAHTVGGRVHVQQVTPCHCGLTDRRAPSRRPLATGDGA